MSIPFVAPFSATEASLLPSDLQILRDRDLPWNLGIDWGSFDVERNLGFARNLKRRIGLRPDRPDAQQDSSEVVYVAGRRIEIPVHRMATFVVSEMKRQAESYLGARIERAVATVPTRFSLRRLQAIRDVYLAAGFREIHLVDESIAAGILGMYNQFLDRPRYTMLVYDMGGGTTDVTLFSVDNEEVDGVLEIRPRVLGVSGSARLGGRDVTGLFVKRFLANLTPDEQRAIPLAGRSLAPEQQIVARRNENALWNAAEDLKLRLFAPGAPAEMTLSISLTNREGQKQLLTPTPFTVADVEAELRPEFEALWREILEMLASAEVTDLDILYLAGRSSRLPLVREGLLHWLTADGRFPRLQQFFPLDAEKRTVLKEAVSLGAYLAEDLLNGIDERLVLEALEDRSPSRFGVRNQRGEFLEILPASWPIGVESVKRQRIRLATPYRSDTYEVHLEVYELPTRDNRIDGNPEAERLGRVDVRLPVEQVGPGGASVDIGLRLSAERSLSLQVWSDGKKIQEVPVAL